MLAEIHHANGHANGHAKPAENGHAEHSQPPEPPEGRIDGELFGLPANASSQNDDRVPGDRQDDHPTKMEEKAPEARSSVRRQLGSKLTSKQYNVPTPTPHVDPHGFEDPICDAFWQKTWLASAVHNVSRVSSDISYASLHAP